jgi:hypothetical protein
MGMKIRYSIPIFAAFFLLLASAGKVRATQQDSPSKPAEASGAAPAKSSGKQTKDKPTQSAPDQPTWDPLRAEKDLEVGQYYMRKGDLDAAIDRFQDAAPDSELEWVVPEEAEMTWAATWRDTGSDRIGQAQTTRCGQPVQVGGAGCLQLCLAVAGTRKTANAVQDQEDNLGLGRNGESLQVVEGNHWESSSGSGVTPRKKMLGSWEASTPLAF